MKNLITYCFRRVILLVVLWMPVSSFGHSAEVVAGTEITSIESAQGQEFVNSWRIVQNAPEVLRLNPKFLDEITDFSDDLIKQLNDDLVNPKYDLVKLFEESPSDVSNVWKRLKEDPYWAHDFAKETTDARWLKCKDREFFKQVTALGRKFEQDVLDDLIKGFKNKSGKVYDKFTNLFSQKGKNLDEYTFFNQVQLDVPGGKMISGIVLIKYDFLGEVQDIIIVESKLKSATNFTTRQKSGWREIFNKKSIKVRSVSIADDLSTGKNLT